MSNLQVPNDLKINTIKNTTNLVYSKPQKRSIFITRYTTKQKYSFFLEFPYIIYGIDESREFYAFFTIKEPIKPGVDIYSIPLSNIDDYGAVCLGERLISHNISIACDKFWNTEFVVPHEDRAIDLATILEQRKIQFSRDKGMVHTYEEMEDYQLEMLKIWQDTTDFISKLNKNQKPYAKLIKNND